MQAFLRECVLVEGKDDLTALANCAQGLFFASRGLQNPASLDKTLQCLAPRLGLILLTDSDGPGERIRAHYGKLIPQARHARISPSRSRDPRTGKLGVAYASSQTILEALHAAGAHVESQAPAPRYPLSFLLSHGLASGPGAKGRREAFCQALGLGPHDSKQVLSILNSRAFSHSEILAALDDVQGDPLCP